MVISEVKIQQHHKETHCPEYAQYAKTIMQKITNDMDGSMGSGVAGEMLENVDSRFVDIDKDNIDNNDDFGIGKEDFELKGKEFACKLNMPSNKHMYETTILVKLLLEQDQDPSILLQSKLPLRNHQSPMLSQVIFEKTQK